MHNIWTGDSVKVKVMLASSFPVKAIKRKLLATATASQQQPRSFFVC